MARRRQPTEDGNLGGEIRILRQSSGVVEEILTLPAKHAVSFVRCSPSGDRVIAFTPGGICSGHFDTASGGSLPMPGSSNFVKVINDVARIDRTRIADGGTKSIAAQDFQRDDGHQARQVAHWRVTSRSP